MTIPALDTIVFYVTIFIAILGALLAAVWLSLVIWTFRDMRLRSRDPFAQLFAAVVVAVLPIVGILIYYILRPPETLAEVYERALEEEALLQEIEERPACAGCSRTLESSWILCPHCHTRARKKCRDCGELMALQWNLCPHCGNHHVDPYHVHPPLATTTTDFDDSPTIAHGIPSVDSVADQPTMPMTPVLVELEKEDEDTQEVPTLVSAEELSS